MSRVPPLVPPGPPLTAAQQERYSRQIMLPGIGEEGQRRLRAARVAVVGAGGLGTPAMQLLARAGVGVLGVIDDDRVERSNLQRQVLHGDADVGRDKVASARDAIAVASPGTDVRTHAVRLTEDNATELLGAYDLVLDGSDNFATRYLVDDTAARLGMPVVWGSALQFDGQLSVFWAARGYRYRDLYPEVPSAAPSCGSAGVLGPVCAVVGAQMAAEAIKVITGVGRPLLGRLAVVDALQGTTRVLSLGAADPTPPGVITAAQLSETLRRAPLGEPVVLVDVREPDEPGGLPGAVRLPLSQIEHGACPATPTGTDVVLYCASGVRSQRAAQLLTEEGFTQVRSLAGGLATWRAVTGEQVGSLA